ncbi:MAG: hypothetical protein IMY67_12955 [Bacteroidetes bacterium]|nr:hypothetical protein [Bacteroidota bacterium]
MKYLYTAILALLFISCANNQKKVNLIKENSSIEDTLLELKTDKLAKDIMKDSVMSPKDCSLIFNEFFEKFSKDSLFQKSRVKYPLKWSYYRESYEKLTIEHIEQKDFIYIDFTEDKNAMQKKSGKYEVVIEKSKYEVNYLLKGYDNGIHMNHIFKLVEGCWFLVEIIDEST